MLTSKCPGVPNATDRIGGDLNVQVAHQSTIYTSGMGGYASMLGQINLQLMEEFGHSKRLTGNCTIMNS